MYNKSESRYLELLKRVLIDYENIDSFESYPLAVENLSFKTFWLRPVDYLLRKRNFSINKLRYVDRAKRMNGEDWPAQAKTMIGYNRLSNIETCIRTIVKENIQGDLIETGIWRGGAVMFMNAVLNELQINDRKIWLADSFLGVPPGSEKYPADRDSSLHQERILKISRQEVEENFRKFDLLDENIMFLEGWFSQTLANVPVEKFSLLRLDGDLYESTFLALTHLYPKLSVGGFVIIDDYHAFPFCEKAVTDFRNSNQITETIISVDQEAVLWRREK